MKNPYIALVGGDLRYVYLAERLSGLGFQVCCFFLKHPSLQNHIHQNFDDFRDGLPFCATVLLPIPVCRSGLTLNAPLYEGEKPELPLLLSAVGKGAVVLGGAPSAAVRQTLADKELPFTDLLELDEVAEQNAVPTAEGAAALAMELLPITLHGARCAVLGAGRCGLALAKLLSAMGATVTLTARRPEQLAAVAAMGFSPLETGLLYTKGADFDIVFNTVPAPVLDARTLASLAPGAPVVELASAPGGIDLDYASSHGVKVVQAPGLPGKVAPKTAADILCGAIVPLLQERGISL